jgi:23S rRNA (cytosine1962-C5)-methyltransferase
VSLQRLILTKETVDPIKKGHPWVYKGGIKGFEKKKIPVGTPVIVVDEKNRHVAFGLVDSGDIIVRILGKQPDKIADLLRRRVLLAYQMRTQILPPHTNAYRILNGEGDLLPGLVVDRYDALLVLKIYASCWEPYLDEILDALEGIPGVNCIFRRYGVRNVDGRKGGDVVSGQPVPEHLVVEENGLKFLVRPKIGQKTGLFLDQRENREFLGRRSLDLRVVNLFAYTGGFSVYAASRGAKQVTTVDIAPEAIEDAKENFRLNGISVDRHIFECADAFSWKSDSHIDMLICDPPSLSHDRKSEKRAAQAYGNLAYQCGQMLKKGSFLASSSCTSRITYEHWEKMISLGLRGSGQWTKLWSTKNPPDHPVLSVHPEGNYLKFALFYRVQ